MKLSLNWLKRYVNLTQSPAEIERALTMIGFEVEGVESTGLPALANIVVGEVLSTEQHPNADRLSVCSVNTGESEPRQIVCGAKNFKVGDRVPVAIPGAVLPGDFKIKKSNLRGVRSEGMMCSAKELGLGDDHAGLLILEARPAVGTPINDVFPGGDTVFDLEVTPNRPDCLSHIGVARELAAYFNLGLDYPEVKASPGGPFNARQPDLVKRISIETPENCPHYRGYSIRGVKIAPSPEWLQELLRSVGLRPVNNVVDVTNFVLFELGQPLHAFDASKIRGAEIIVRNAKNGEKITTLDGKERPLDPLMMVIADAERPLVVAGVMGSLDAEVDDSTTDVFLEAAYFAPSNIRRTARRLGLSTDSSYRFERGIDPNGAEYAALRAIDLILETTGGVLCGPAIVAGEPSLVEREIVIGADYLRKRIGFDVADAEIASVFERLGLDTHAYDGSGGAEFKVSIPSYRIDLERPIDLVEEFLRIYGTDKIPSGQVSLNALVGGDDPLALYVRNTSQFLSARGFSECVNYPMRSEAEIRHWYTNAAAENLALANPLTNDQSHLRSSILPGLLDNLRLNLSRGNRPAKLFEVGRIFREENGHIWELIGVGFVLYHQPEGEWKALQAPEFGDAQTLCMHVLGQADIQIQPSDFQLIQSENVWQEGHSAHAGGFDVGFEARCGLLNLTMSRNWDIPQPVVAGAVWIKPELLGRARPRPGFKPFSLFPPATRDIALLVPDKVDAGKVQHSLVAACSTAMEGKNFQMEEVRLFDVYQGKGLPEGSKSLAFTISFRSPERTLTDNEVNPVFEQIQKLISAGEYSVRS